VYNTSIFLITKAKFYSSERKENLHVVGASSTSIHGYGRKITTVKTKKPRLNLAIVMSLKKDMSCA
jgi:hypothetical protein